MNPYLHIVCLDAPSPPDYGGAIDMYFKIAALAKSGRKIILHYFNYNKSRSTKGLEEYCEAIHAYKRLSPLTALPIHRPFIVGSRINKALIERLNGDEHPILLEGLHCAGIIQYLNKRERIVLRMHNEEASYYHHLQKNENNFLKRFYFGREAALLKKFQLTLPKDIKLAVLSQSDIEAFKKGYGFTNLHFIPCFIPWQLLSSKNGSGAYCLYHGNMAVGENEEAALWLMKNVFNDLKVPLIIAGNRISKRLQATAKKHLFVSLVDAPSIKVLDGLIREAHINILPSLNRTGVKLKLLHVLLDGRFCTSNKPGIEGSGISAKALIIADSIEELKSAIQQKMGEKFTIENAVERKAILQLYNNSQNAIALNALW